MRPNEREKFDHVSETAFWVAAYKSEEAQSEKPAFTDPLVSKLVAERGKQLIETMPLKKSMAFAMVVRTTAIDRLVHSAIAKGVDTVINLGAGLDTRPYRLNLPINLKWIELDFPELIEYKNKILKNDQPKCHLQRIGIDLSKSERANVLKMLGENSKSALVITEGVIAYLSNGEAGELSRELYSIPSFKFWIQDYRQGKLNKRAEAKLSKKLRRAPFQFDVPDSLVFFQEHGWLIDENIRILDEADRIGRKLPFIFPWSFLGFVFPKTFRKLGNSTYGYVTFHK